MSSFTSKIKAFFSVKRNAVITAVTVALLLIAAVALCLIYGTPGRYAYAQKYCVDNPQAALNALVNVSDGYKDAAKLKQYTQALIMAENGETQQAIEILTKLDYYKDCRIRVKNLYYELASKQLENGEYDAAIENFEKSGTDDSQTMIAAVKYKKALAAEESGDCAAAAEMFSQLGDYEDSLDRRFQNIAAYISALPLKDACDIVDREAQSLADAAEAMTAGVYAEVLSAFNEIRMSYAEELMENEMWQEAIDRLLTVDGDYGGDAAEEKLVYCRSMLVYIDAVALMEAEDYAEAIELFDTIPGFLDSDERNRQCEGKAYKWEFSGFMTSDGTKTGKTTKFKISDSFYVCGTLTGGKPQKTLDLRFVWTDKLGYTATSTVTDWENGMSGTVRFYYTVPENARAGKNTVKVYNDRTGEVLATYTFTTKK